MNGTTARILAAHLRSHHQHLAPILARIEAGFLVERNLLEAQEHLEAALKLVRHPEKTLSAIQVRAQQFEELQ